MTLIQKCWFLAIQYSNKVLQYFDFNWYQERKNDSRIEPWFIPWQVLVLSALVQLVLVGPDVLAQLLSLVLLAALPRPQVWAEPGIRGTQRALLSGLDLVQAQREVAHLVILKKKRRKKKISHVFMHPCT